MEKDQAAEHALLARAAAAAAATVTATEQERQTRFQARKEEYELAEASNAVIDLVHNGKLDQAEQAARELLVRYPEVHDGYDRLGQVYQARGQNKQAADCYRKVIDFIHAHPDDYDPEFEAVFHELVTKLDPPTTPT